MKLKKIILFISFFVVCTIVLMSLFPSLFTDKELTEKSIMKLPPNKGYNVLKITNTSGKDLKIDSLFIHYNKNEKLKIAGSNFIKCEQAKEIRFQIIRIPQKLDKKLKITMFASGGKKSVNLRFNQMMARTFGNNSSTKINTIKLSRRENIYTGSMRAMDFKGIDEPLSNRINVRSILGTDFAGREIWSRIVYGADVIVKIILLTLLISIPLGTIVGLLRGYYNNFLTGFLTVLSNLANSISVYILTMMIIAVLHKHELIYVVIAFSLVQWVEMEKIIYEKVSVIKQKDFISSSKMFGKTNFEIIFKDILILCIPDIIIGSVALAKRIILIEASLSFLGYSVTEPYSSWGNIISGAKNSIYSNNSLWQVIPPIIAILLTAFSFDFLEKYLTERVK